MATINHNVDVRPIVTRYSMHRTGTGRLASGTDPTEAEKSRGLKPQQVQNIPKGLRDIFHAEPGHVFIGGDWSAIEWALVMYFASKLNHPKDFHKNTLDSFQSGDFDPHSWLAAHAYELPYLDLVAKKQRGEKVPERQICKVYTHGYNYDGSPDVLAQNAGHPIKIGRQVCKAHDKAFKTRAWKNYEVSEVKQYHYVETPLGWRRYFWDLDPKPQEVLASKVQGTAACLCKWILLRIAETLPEEARIVTTTHDSFVLQWPAGSAEMGAEYLAAQMEQKVPWLDDRKWKSEIDIGHTWKAV